jgi:hypothetical protein
MTATSDGHIFDTPFNVVAAFRERRQADLAARRLMSAGVPASRLEVGVAPDMGGPVETAELRADMQDELNANWAVATGGQTTGAAFGTAAFAFVGLVLGLLAGLLVNVGVGLDMSLAGTMIIGGVVGLVGGATVGLVAGGGIAPRVQSAGQPTFDDPRPAGERDVLLAVHATRPETAEQAARVLRDELHAERVHLVDADGTPLPPQHGQPRPGDPEGYWWKEAGEG